MQFAKITTWDKWQTPMKKIPMFDKRICLKRLVALIVEDCEVDAKN